jgi:hypothetical protein
MKRTVLLFMYVIFLALVSCYQDGSPGPAGANGKDAVNNVAGTNGVNGVWSKVFTDGAKVI